MGSSIGCISPPRSQWGRRAGTSAFLSSPCGPFIGRRGVAREGGCDPVNGNGDAHITRGREGDHRFRWRVVWELSAFGGCQQMASISNIVLSLETGMVQGELGLGRIPYEAARAWLQSPCRSSMYRRRIIKDVVTFSKRLETSLMRFKISSQHEMRKLTMKSTSRNGCVAGGSGGV